MPLPTTLDEWLAHCERLHPSTIDMTLSRMTELKARLGLAFKVPVVGTKPARGVLARLAARIRRRPSTTPL